MRYNLSPLLDVHLEELSNTGVWKDRIKAFFNNENYDPKLLDQYYDILIDNYEHYIQLINYDYIIDEYSGLFTFDTPEKKTIHTFNLANFVRRNHLFFDKKSIQTMVLDYGIVNVQLKLCGLNLKSTAIPKDSQAGAVLTVIGNDCPPYDFTYHDCDVIIAANIFNGEEDAWRNWNLLLDSRLIKKKEIFFCSNSFADLQKYINYDKIEQVEDPTQVYDEHTYANTDLGYMTKIYRIV